MREPHTRGELHGRELDESSIPQTEAAPALTSPLSAECAGAGASGRGRPGVDDLIIGRAVSPAAPHPEADDCQMLCSTPFEVGCCDDSFTPTCHARHEPAGPFPPADTAQ